MNKVGKLPGRHLEIEKIIAAESIIDSSMHNDDIINWL